MLRRQLPGRSLQLSEDNRRRLAVRAYRLGRQRLRAIATIVTPDTWTSKCPIEALEGVQRRGASRGWTVSL